MSKRIALIVDDSASMRMLVAGALEDKGFGVMQAVNGQEAWDSLKALPRIDLVITDLNMPVMDGITFVQKLRAMATYKYTPVLLLTTETRTEQKDKAKAAGATGWLTKPFDPTKLMAVVQRVLP